MKMGAAPTLVFLSLLLSVALARNAHLRVTDDPERNPLSMDDNINLHDLEKVFKNMISSFEDSPAESSRLCLEISRKAKGVLNDQDLINEIDSLASTLCHMVPSDLEAKLEPCEVCNLCHNTLDAINNVLGNTERQFLILVYLLKSCENQTSSDQCKKKVFRIAPIVMTGLQMIVKEDICYMVHICEYPRDKAQYAKLDNHACNQI